MPLLPREPFVDIQDGNAGRVAIRIHHYGQVPDIRLEFSPEVLRQAVNKWRRTTREHQILTAARKLSPTAYRIVEAHLIRERALEVEHKIAAKARRASWSQRRDAKPQQEEREQPVRERAEYDPLRDAGERSDRPKAVASEKVLDERADSWWDVLTGKDDLPEWTPDFVPETLTERAQRELAEEKSRKPKVSRSERTAIQRALAEREESLRDLVEFEPQRQTATQKALRESNAERAQPQPERDRDRSR